MNSILEELQPPHAKRILCSRPRNALLHIPDDLLVYIISLFKNGSPVPPDVSAEQWSDLLSILNSHWILPLLYWRIGSLPKELHPPEDITSHMRESFLINRMRCIQMEKQLHKILDAFNKQDIRALVLKGPALALTVYPDPATRPCGDLDLLVHPEQVVQSRKILECLGYKCLRKTFEAFKDYFCEEQFIHRNNRRANRMVELHWGLHPFLGISQDVGIEDLFLRAVKVESSSFTFEGLHPVDALIHMAFHIGIIHNNNIRLLWVYDIALLASQLMAPDDWRSLQERSVAWRARLPLEHYLKMAQFWFALELPSGFGDFSRWPKPAEDEVTFYSSDILREERVADILKLRCPKSSGAFEKAQLLFYLLFPSPDFMRKHHPHSHRWQLPLTYIRRWLKWMVRI